MGWRKELAGLCTFIILSNGMGSLSVRADESISGKLTVWEHSITFEMPWRCWSVGLRKNILM